MPTNFSLTSPRSSPLPWAKRWAVWAPKRSVLRERPEIFIAVDGSPTPPEVDLTLDGRPAIWTRDRLAPYDVRLVRDFLALAQTAGT